MKILVTGSQGFIAGYTIAELLAQGHSVVGIDNFSKYGFVKRASDDHPNYKFVEGDAKNTGLLKDLLSDCEQLIAGAAMVGGISYFHKHAYDLLAENERIMASTFDAALWAFKERRLSKINIISSSMAFENTTVFPTPEGEQTRCPPPSSTYGFQKLSSEYFAKGAWEQYKLPYTIIRPFNCIGIGEYPSASSNEICSGNLKMVTSHVVPDLVCKLLKNPGKLHILGEGRQIRHYTYGGDLAKGILLCVTRPQAVNEDFNLSTSESTTVIELAKLIWRKIRGSEKFAYVADDPFRYDVQKRIPAVDKAKDLLGYQALTSLDEALDEIIPWIKKMLKIGKL